MMLLQAKTMQESPEAERTNEASFPEYSNETHIKHLHFEFLVSLSKYEI